MPSKTMTAKIKGKIRGHQKYVDSFRVVDNGGLFFIRTDSKGNTRIFSPEQKEAAIEEHLQSVATGIQKIFGK